MEQKIETRVCRECGKELPITDFYKTGIGDKRMHTCKRCVQDRRRKTKDAKENAPYINMSKFDDELLFAELRKRGYTGELQLSKTIAV